MIILNGAPIIPTIFPDKTSQVWKLPKQQLQMVGAHIVWGFEHEGEFMHLAQLLDLLAAHGIKRDLHLPYLPYARQDKDVSNDATFALHTFVRLLAALRPDRVVLYDPHNAAPVVTGLGCDVLVRGFVAEARAAFVECEADTWWFPDAGAAVRYRSLLCVGESFGSAEKVRDPATGAITGLSLHVLNAGQMRRVMIVDDICDGGATFIALAQKLREAGASDVFLFVSHGIFSRGLRPLLDAGISRIFTPEGEKAL